jgi:hypothetical protein
MCVCLSDYLPSISLSLILEIYLSTDPSFLLLIVYTSLLAQYNCTLHIILLYPHSLSSSAFLISSPHFHSSPSILASPLCSSPHLSSLLLFSSLLFSFNRYVTLYRRNCRYCCCWFLRLHISAVHRCDLPQ